jgi:HEAT repeat protein
MALIILLAVTLGHGGSARSSGSASTAPPPGSGGGSAPVIVIRTGRTLTGTGGPVSGPATSDRAGRHTWEDWWNYHREYYLALRTRGPITGIRVRPDQQSGGAPRERILEVLLRALVDKDPGVRGSAAIALGKYGPVAREALESRVHDIKIASAEVREALIYGVGLLGLPGNRILLDGVARDPARGPKERSLALLGLMMDGTRESADLLVEHARLLPGEMVDPEDDPLRSEQDRCRFALHLLGFVELPGHEDFLAEIVGGAGTYKGGERGLAVTALGRIRARGRMEQLFRILEQKGTERNVRRFVLIAFGMMLKPDDADALGRLARFIRDARKDPVAQHFAVMALGQVGGDAAVELLKGLLDERVFGDVEDRAFVHLALGLAGMRSAAAREALVEQYRRVRTEAESSVLALACGLARAEEAIPLTIASMERPRFRGTRRPGARDRFLGAAALGLGLQGDARGLDAVRKAMALADGPIAREQAAIGLVLLEGEKAVGALVGILRNERTSRGKAAAVAALGVLRSPSAEAIDALVRVYRDPDAPDGVRAMAICALGTLADERPVPVAALLVRGYDYYIACLALDEIATYL